MHVSAACECVICCVRVLPVRERSRVTSTSKANERSYHVFYELCASNTEYAPEAVTSYRYLSMSGTTTAPGQDDAEEAPHRAAVV